MPKNFKIKSPLTPPKEGNRKNSFPKITRESNPIYGTSLIFCSFKLQVPCFRFRSYQLVLPFNMSIFYERFACF